MYMYFIYGNIPRFSPIDTHQLPVSDIPCHNIQLVDHEDSYWKLYNSPPVYFIVDYNFTIML